MADDVSDSTTSGAQLPHENEPADQPAVADTEEQQSASAEASQGHDGVAPASSQGAMQEQGGGEEKEPLAQAGTDGAAPASAEAAGGPVEAGGNREDASAEAPPEAAPVSAEASADQAAPGGIAA